MYGTEQHEDVLKMLEVRQLMRHGSIGCEDTPKAARKVSPNGAIVELWTRSSVIRPSQIQCYYL